MSLGLIAKASVSIHAPADKVWEALIDPDKIKQYMFGTEVLSDWKEGSPIVWAGMWKGKYYQDKGVILKIEKEKKIEFTHFSPLEGLPDMPENYHTLTYELSGQGDETVLSLSQDNNPTETAKEHSQKNWEKMLVEIKNLLEKEENS